ncbi:MAG: hypothetical protein HYW25_02260 [Candidatus Aenigmarchaeota archaeon]|nr:hypothetical protein [Candidatus Aenigmarchaeota archaeon]
MLTKTEKNWKGFLKPEDEARLNAYLENVAQHRGAYFNADEVKIAQLWCALLESEKRSDRIEERLKRMEFLLEGFLSRYRRLRAEECKEPLTESLEKF